MANKRNYRFLGIESGLQLAFAAPVLERGFGLLPSFSGMVREVTAQVHRAQVAIVRFVEPHQAAIARAFKSTARVQAAPAPRVASPQQITRPMTLADQWAKISEVLISSVDGARVATEMQSAATQQLDLAQYGLITLVDELSAVMTMPGRRSRSATVHAFNGASESFQALTGKGRSLAA